MRLGRALQRMSWQVRAPTYHAEVCGLATPNGRTTHVQRAQCRLFAALQRDAAFLPQRRLTLTDC